MSEIKGQLLGIVLAIALFGVVFGILVNSFGRTSSAIGNRMAEVATTQAEYAEAQEAAPAAAAPAGGN
ncbi:MAG: hypothetical protein IJQ40_00515 [Bacilli bacterium]|nr:hypothetical protein [Bacilli bacterium]MBR0193866.1 hypothetical protein [Bacilli bacterium]